jgi:hypothetical protein
VLDQFAALAAGHLGQVAKRLDRFFWVCAVR